MCWLSNFLDKFHTNCKKSKDTSIPTKPYRDGKYKVSHHGVERMNERKITKGEVHVNLHTTPVKKTKVKYDSKGRPSYERYSHNKINTRINPRTNKVTTVSRYHTSEYNKLTKKGAK